MRARRGLAIVAIACACLAACAAGERRAARERYNAGVAALGEQKFEDAEKAFMDAIGDAGVDPELRGRAAFDLGVAYAQHAKQLSTAQPPDYDKALELLHLAAAWFQDANRTLPDPDAVTNLAIVTARAQALADDVNRGKNGLEPRLDRLIKAQRGVRDGVQQVWDAVVAAGAAADPTRSREAYEQAATAERTLLAEAGTISDMAGDEIGAIGAKPQEQRSDQEKARLVQLQNLDLYLIDARTAMSDARRQLQALSGADARASAEAALEALKRAREQLLDPIKVLQELADDGRQLVADSEGTADATRQGKQLGATEAPAIAASMRPAVLAERDARIKDRVDEVIARLQAGVEHAGQADAAAGSGAGAPGAPGAPGAAGAPAAADAAAKKAEEQKVMAMVVAALPSVKAASEAFGKAKDALGAERLDDAVLAERDGVVDLYRAIEQFSDLKQLIELAYGQQHTLAEVLGDPAELAKMPPEVRARVVEDGVAQNLARLGRLQGLIGDAQAEQLAKLQQAAQQQAAQAPQGGGAGSGAGDAAAAAQQQVEATKQLYARAEELRGQALAATEALQKALAAKGGDPVTPAKDAEAKLSELRQLFFNLIEHLQQLIRDQGETDDRTATARSADDDARAAALPAIVARQAEHQQMGQAIADALAQQADQAAQAAAQAQGPQAQQAQQQAKAMSDAEDEMKQAIGAMQSAAQALGEAQKQAQTASVDLQPTMDAQGQALTHLENALRLLQPPPPPQDDKNDKDKKDQKQDQQKQDQQKQDQQKQDQQKQDQQQQQQQQQKDDASAQEAQRRAQQVRDSEAKRQRERRERDRQRLQPEPVDKDW